MEKLNIATAASGACVPTVVLATACGDVAGIDGQVRAFLGIPYGEPAVGERRWRAPVKARPWSGVLDATQFGDDCPQASGPMLRAAAQSEDCLYLNVWTPADAAGASLPVMVWIHGGGFVGGSGADVRCDGAALAARGVVVVTLNYRSGIFGFLAHAALSRESPQGVSGNYGLLDQIAALEWIRDNIAAFGGDSRRVTVMGGSAGSASIALLLTSPLAHGLFQQAVLHSPGTCRPLGSLDEAEHQGAVLGEDIDALRRLPAEDLFARTRMLVPKMRGLTTPRLLRPIRDGWLLPQDELPAFTSGEFQKMPILIGTNADEGSKLTRTWSVDTLAQYRELLEQNFGSDAARAAELYSAGSDAEVRGRVAELFGDTQFDYGTLKLARAMAGAGQPTYRYVFRRRPPGQSDGPHHGDELAYVFGTLELLPSEAAPAFDATDREVSRTMLEAWVRFAQSGDPNGGSLPRWPRFDAVRGGHLEFGDRVTQAEHWRDAQLEFIDGFMSQRYAPGAGHV